MGLVCALFMPMLAGAEIPRNVVVNGKPKTTVITDSEYGTSLGWAVSVRNGTNQELNMKLYVKIRFLDKQGIMLDEVKKEVGTIKAFQSVNLTDKTYLSAGVWGRVHRIEAVLDENYF